MFLEYFAAFLFKPIRESVSRTVFGSELTAMKPDTITFNPRGIIATSGVMVRECSAKIADEIKIKKATVMLATLAIKPESAAIQILSM